MAALVTATEGANPFITQVPLFTDLGSVVGKESLEPLVASQAR